MIQKIKNLYHFFVALLAVIAFRFPARRLVVIGVTGTDGKTTTTNLIYHLLSRAGFKVGMISTVGAKMGKKEIKTGFHVTTPNPIKIQRLLRQMVKKGIEFVILEATSHGLDQHRLSGCHFKIGVITNVTHEHLDYHGTYQNYLKAKAKLFRGVEFAILNQEDQSYQFLKKKMIRKAKIVSYGLKKGDLTPKTFPFKTKLKGGYNQANALAAIAVAKILQIPEEKIRKALLSFPGIKGRLEEIRTGRGFNVFVDFAHTPRAFEEVIPTVRKLTKREIIHVFGCTGDRDRSKRPEMGRIAAQLSDKVILTHEDTYSEDPEKIISEIEPGVRKGGKVLGQTYWKALKRGEAIEAAIRMAKKGDSVLLTGVGHQTTLNLGGKEVSWSDQQAAKKAIKKLGA